MYEAHVLGTILSVPSYFIALYKWQSFLLSFYFSCFAHLSTIINIATIEAKQKRRENKE